MQACAMPKIEITANETVEQIMRNWPDTIRVFLRYRMACFGCTMSGLDTVADASAEYGLPLDEFLDELRAAAGLAKPGGR